MTPLSDQETHTGNPGVLKTYPCCTCCAESECNRFLDETVTCAECGFSCSCEGCVADYGEDR